MPPKLTRPKAFSWAKGNGTLTPTARGIVYGMHLSGQSAGDIAAMMNIARKSVYQTIRSVNAEVNGRKDDECSSDSEPGETTVAARVEERREKIDELMLEKKEDGNFAIGTSSCKTVQVPTLQSLLKSFSKNKTFARLSGQPRAAI